MKYSLIVLLLFAGICSGFAQQKRFSIEPTFGINNNTCYIEEMSSHSSYFSVTHPLVMKRIILLNTGIYIHYRINEKFKIKAGYTNAQAGTSYSLISPDGTVALGGFVGLHNYQFPMVVYYDAVKFKKPRIKIQTGLGFSVDRHPNGPYGDLGVSSAVSLTGAYTISVSDTPYISKKTTVSLRGALVFQLYSKSEKERFNLSVDYNLGLSPYGGAIYTHSINNQQWTTRVVTKGTYVGLNLGFIIGVIK